MWRFVFVFVAGLALFAGSLAGPGQAVDEGFAYDVLPGIQRDDIIIINKTNTAAHAYSHTNPNRHAHAHPRERAVQQVRHDRSGDEARSYALLKPSTSGANAVNPDAQGATSLSVITTYSDMPDATRLRVHLTDGAGASRAAYFGKIEKHDVVEVRESDTCWARYVVAETPTAIGTGDVSRDLAVRWGTFRKTGCSGDIDPSALDPDTTTVNPTPIRLPVYVTVQLPRVTTCPPGRG